MSVYRITVILDDAVPAQATLLGQIQNTLASIASVLPPVGNKNIEVTKLS